MNKKRIGRIAAAMGVAATVAVSGVVLPASPAAARPKDCSFSVRISPDPGAMYARADVNCANKEDYEVRIFIRRKDAGGITWTPVADVRKGFNKAGRSYVSATEPCSDVQTNKKYKAHAKLYDARLPGPAIEVKEVFSGEISGHC